MEKDIVTDALPLMSAEDAVESFLDYDRTSETYADHKGICSAPAALHSTSARRSVTFGEEPVHGDGESNHSLYHHTPSTILSSLDSQVKTRPSDFQLFTENSFSRQLKQRLYDCPKDSEVLKMITPHPPTDNKKKALITYRSSGIHERKKRADLGENSWDKMRDKAEINHILCIEEENNNEIVHDLPVKSQSGFPGRIVESTALYDKGDLSLFENKGSGDRVPLTYDLYPNKSILEVIRTLFQRLNWPVEGVLDGVYPKRVLNRTIDTHRILRKDDDGTFAYCLPRRHGNPKERYNPYDLVSVLISSARKSRTFFTVSASYVTRITKNEEPFLTPLEEWMDERKKFCRVFHLPVFAQFRLRKTFMMWKAIVRSKKNNLSKDIMESSLFILQPAMQNAVLEIRGITESVCEKSSALSLNQREQITLLALNRGSTISLQKFYNSNVQQTATAVGSLNHAREDVVAILEKACKEILEKEMVKIIVEGGRRKEEISQTKSQQLHQNRSLQKTKAKYGLEEKAGVSNSKDQAKNVYKYSQGALIKSTHLFLSRFVRYIDFILMDMLKRLVGNSVVALHDYFKASSKETPYLYQEVVQFSSWVEEREKRKRQKLDEMLFKEEQSDQVAIPPVFKLTLKLKFSRSESEFSILEPFKYEDLRSNKKSVAFSSSVATSFSTFPSSGKAGSLSPSSSRCKTESSFQQTVKMTDSKSLESACMPYIIVEPDKKDLLEGILQIIYGFELAAAGFKSLLEDPKLIQYCVAPTVGHELWYDKELSAPCKESKRPWPDIELLFGEDGTYQDNIGQIVNILTSDVQEMEDFSKYYDQYCDMVYDARTVDVDKSVTERTWSTNDFNSVLAQFTEQLGSMRQMITQKRCGMFLVEAEGFKDSCLPYTHRVISTVSYYLPQIACKRNEKLLKVIRNAEKRLNTVGSNVSEFVEHLSFISKISNDMPSLEREYKVVCKLFVIAVNFSVSFESEDWALYQTLTPSFHQLKTTLLYCEANKDENIQKFLRELHVIVGELHHEVAMLKNRVRNPMLIDEDVMPVAALENLNFLEEEMILLRQNATNYTEYEEKFTSALSAGLKKKKFAFDSDYQKYKGLDSIGPAAVKDLKGELSEVERDLALRKLLWESFEDWNKVTEKWQATPFESINVEELQKEVNRFVQTAFLLEKGLPPNRVVPNLKQRIVNFRLVMPIISSLRNPTLQPRHWDEIKTIMGTTIVRDKTFTLENFLNLELLDKKDAIAEVSSQASNEAALEQMLSRVVDFWNQQDFQLVAHSGKDIAVIGGADEILSAIDESLVTLANIKSSRFCEPIMVAVDDWERKLQLFLKCFEEWMIVQRNWLYLETIFAAPDIQRQLVQESKLFHQIDRNLKDIMRRVIDRPNALRAATTVGVLEILQSCKSNLEKIHRGLEDYLETKRAVFARFYFLSNDELLDILSNTKNYNAVEPHLSKCFGNVQRFQFTQDLTTSPNITALVSAENEYFPLTRDIRVRGTVEQWLLHVENAMYDAVKLYLKKAMHDYEEENYIAWLLSHPGQVGLTVSLIMFTQQVVEALSSNDVKTRLGNVRSLLFSFLSELALLTSRPLEQYRLQLAVSLIVVMVHLRDIVSQLIQEGVTSPTDFTWTRNLRYRWEDSSNTCLVYQSRSSFPYGFEYLGCASRLVITPLTNRCYLTLTGALSLNLGGSPVGPAGTGKTETVKDLAKVMGKQCLVYNCSEGLEHKMIAKFLLGLTQAGSWCCFDEFNRIDVEVLSVVAQQLYAIKAAKDASSVRFIFEGRDVRLNPTCGVFITMNPGYAGRVELPENLKSLFRPVAMVVPDFDQITEVTLYSVGFQSAAVFSRKLVKVYELAAKQLSKQDHYDFGLRAIKTVLIMAGQFMRRHMLIRQENHSNEEEEARILVSAVLHANIPKFIAEDATIFRHIIRDIFPGTEVEEQRHANLEKAVGISLRELALQRWPSQTKKVIQLHETLLIRHGAMLVGPTGGGKTSVRNILQKALISLPSIYANDKEDVKTESSGPSSIQHIKKGRVDAVSINPKCLSLGQLYGKINENTMDWTDGLLSSVFRKFATKSSRQSSSHRERSESHHISRATSVLSKQSESFREDSSKHGIHFSDSQRESFNEWHWVVFDGPVDTVWVENLNTVLDDSKVLCLANGERIALTASMRLLFEVDDLSQASPATISRCGMVYMDPAELGWRPFVRSWMHKLRERKVPQEARDYLHTLFEYTIDPGLAFLKDYSHHQYIKVPTLSVIGTLCSMLDALITYMVDTGGFGDVESTPQEGMEEQENRLGTSRKSARHHAKKNYVCNNPTQLNKFVGKLFAFAFIWAFGGNFDSPPDDTEEVWISSSYRRASLSYDIDLKTAFDSFVHELFESNRSLGISFPTGQCHLSSYYVDFDKGQFSLWENLVPATTSPTEKSLGGRFGTTETVNELDDASPYSSERMEKMLIPTVDTVRFSFIIALLALNGRPVLLNGESGIGKSLLINDILRRVSLDGGSGISIGTILGSIFSLRAASVIESIVLPSENRSESKCTPVVTARCKVSPKTSPDRIRSFVESKLAKVGKGTLGSNAGEKVLFFIDDLNVSQPQEYGAQPSLELIRDLLANRNFYDPDKMKWKQVRDVSLIFACSPPGGGRYPLSQRLLHHISVFCLQQPSVSCLHHIYQIKLGRHMERQEFSLGIQTLQQRIVWFVLGAYFSITAKLRPTPARCHYLFSIRDISKAFEGIMNATTASAKTEEQFFQLVAHEVTRVFYDRLADAKDRMHVNTIIVNGFRDIVKHRWKVEAGQPTDLMFCDFLNIDTPDMDRVYACVEDTKRLKQSLEDLRDRATVAGKDIFSDLVFFPDAIAHLIRICRVLRQKAGHIALIGIGGSGKTLLARFGAHIQQCVFIQPTLSRNYSLSDFRDDIKRAFHSAGAANKRTIFFINDRDIIKEEYLECICALLTSGDIPDLYDHEDKEKLTLDLQKEDLPFGIKDHPERIYEFFLNRVRNQLHVVLSTSPSGAIFRERCRTYPEIVSHCTVDWYDEWSADALLAVAKQHLSDMGLVNHGDNSESIVNSAAEMLRICHQDVEKASKQFHIETRRHFYVTPRSFLGLIDLFKHLCEEKENEAQLSRVRLKGGLEKLSESNALVSSMQKELTELGPKLEEQAVRTKEILKQLAADQDALDKVRNVVIREEEVTNRETQKVELAAKEAQGDLESVLPQVEAALAALDSLDKNDIAEIRVYTKPPAMVMTVLSAVCTLLDKKPDWPTAKLLLGDPGFLKRLVNYDKNAITDKTYDRLKRITKHPDFTPAAVGKISSACRSMCQWVLALQHYTHVYRLVEPKQKKCEAAQKALDIAVNDLQQKKAALERVQDQVQVLETQYNDSVEYLESLKGKKLVTELRLKRAGILIKALEKEKTRWQDMVANLLDTGTGLVGSALLSAVSISYLGAFTKPYREQLIGEWKQDCENLKLSVISNYSVTNHLGDRVQVQRWHTCGLPADLHSTENAIFIMKGRNWPYIIDPQEQAFKWILELEKLNGLKIIKASDPNITKPLEDAIRIGRPVLIEDAKENLDPALYPILNRCITIRNNQTFLVMGETVLVYNDKFRLYIVSKIPNPNLLPEDCTKVNLINFTITFDALKDQLLSDVVRQERPDLEAQRTSLLLNIVSDRVKLRQLEDRSLDLLHTAKGYILDDEELIETLDRTKQTAAIIEERVSASEETEKNISKSRDIYSSVAHRGAVLYMTIADLALVDSMYQFSLGWFKRSFASSIAPVNDTEHFSLQRRGSRGQIGRSSNLSVPNKMPLRLSKSIKRESNSMHKYLGLMIRVITENIFLSVSHSLFARHRLLFSFYICAKIQLHKEEDGTSRLITDEEWSWLLQGKGKMEDQNSDSSVVESKPLLSGISSKLWKDCISVSRGLQVFAALPFHLTQHLDAWKNFLSCDNPVHFIENDFGKEVSDDLATDSNWHPSKLSSFQQLILIKIFRPETLLDALRDFVKDTMGIYFVNPPSFDFTEVFEQSDCRTPIIFILSPGSDPTSELLRFAREIKGSTSHIDLVSLGRGQGKRAEELIRKSCSQHGRWIFLQNCHLAGSFMPKLQEIVREMGNPNIDVDAQSRLWLSTKPHPDFPIPILQASIKATVEPPPGIKANLLRSFASVGGTISRELFEDNACGLPWRTLVFGLCLFHAIVQERKKFGTLGWNIPYHFIPSDLEVSVLILGRWMSEGANVPWTALRLLTGEIVYGGRVTDKWDQRCLLSLLQPFYDDAVLKEDHQFSRDIHIIPEVNFSSFDNCCAFIELLPDHDSPDIFGMHPNADIECSKEEVNRLFEYLIAMQPCMGENESFHHSEDEQVLNIADEILRTVPRRVIEPHLSAIRNASSLSMKNATPTSLSPSPKPLQAVGIDEYEPTDGSNCALQTFFEQERGYFDNLLIAIHESVLGLVAALDGKVVMSQKFESIYQALLQGHVPHEWQDLAYSSSVKLGSWVSNLAKRVKFLSICLGQSPTSRGTRLAANQAVGSTKVYAYWLPAFFYPQGFMTSVLQMHARKLNVSIDSLFYDHEITTEEWLTDIELAAKDLDYTAIVNKVGRAPEVGVLIFGLYLDGARWNFLKKTLAECSPKERFCPAPIIHMKPVSETASQSLDSKRKSHGKYECPLYRTAARASQRHVAGHKANFVTSINMPTTISPDHWIRRGVAMICETDH